MFQSTQEKDFSKLEEYEEEEEDTTHSHHTEEVQGRKQYQ